MRWILLLVAVAAGGCVYTPAVLKTLDDAEKTLDQARAVHARECAPEELAQAEADAAFTHLELRDGNLPRAQDHAQAADDWAKKALKVATPCGTADRDGDGIADLDDKCPDQPEEKDGEPRDGCPKHTAKPAPIPVPTNADRDGDGIPDKSDMCPDTPEDKDGFQDQDGCPDPDNDNDGIPDVQDKCPNQAGPASNHGCPLADRDHDGIPDAQDKCPDQPETVNGYLDDDGCPDTPPTRVKVTKKKITLNDHVHFQTGSATVLPDSFPLLDDVAKVLHDAPTMTIRIEGHTDSVGSDDANMKLSQDRADSVRAYLIRQGIDPDRMTAVGYGETRPIDTNRTAEGRANNRRVEFDILNQ